jgi:hypothetical protein
MSGTSGAQLPVTVGTAAAFPTIIDDEFYTSTEEASPGPLYSDLPIMDDDIVYIVNEECRDRPVTDQARDVVEDRYFILC